MLGGIAAGRFLQQKRNAAPQDGAADPGGHGFGGEQSHAVRSFRIEHLLVIGIGSPVAELPRKLFGPFAPDIADGGQLHCRVLLRDRGQGRAVGQGRVGAGADGDDFHDFTACTAGA